MELSEEEYFAHYGTPRHSGRYPWGSGDEDGGMPRNSDFLDRVKDLKKKGLTETEIAKGMGMTTTELRATKSIELNRERQEKISTVEKLKAKGLSNGAIAQKMGLAGESSVRALSEPSVKDRADILQTVSNMLRDQVSEKTFIDIGSGVENHIGISSDKLKTAVAILRAEGYQVHNVNVTQLGTGLDTKVKVLCPPGTTQKDVFMNRENIKLINNFSDDGGRSMLGIHPPLQINPDRVGIVYGDKGALKDGVTYVRPGVDDISLGASSYAQVRIAVGKSHYIKGVAMYSKDLPDGVDLLFHTNKKDSGNKLDALKPISDDQDNPFGAQINRQIVERDKRGKEHVTSAMNIIYDEGDWAKWSDNIAPQVLSKQSTKLAKDQLAKTYRDKQEEFDAIMAMTNPSVKKKLLESFADSADSSAVHMKAAPIPRQGVHVILPIVKMPENEVYAPNYRPGETVVLIRYPHAGKFEIPELTVNNSHPTAKKTLGQAKDAIGINPKVAERMSGADFDGDFVLVIPNGTGKIKTSEALAGLKDFDPRSQYKAYEGMPKMTAKVKGQQMGDVSNLITDMTIHKASASELARAVRHSMVVIDAEKHNLNYKQSAIDNNIAALKQRYQTKPDSTGLGASTLISRAKSEIRIEDRKARTAAKGGPIDRETGAKVYEPTGRMVVDKDGNLVPRLIKSKKLAETDDARTLSSGTLIEEIYASHSNSLKALANTARLESTKTPPLKYSPSAKKVFEKEVESLVNQVDLARRNRPLERNAQILATSVYRDKKQSNPNMDDTTKKKIQAQALQEARNRLGAKKEPIIITDREWLAIQAGAISPSRLADVLNNADMDRVKELASPRPKKLMTPTNQARAKAMLNSGASRAEVADALGVSLSTLDRELA